MRWRLIDFERHDAWMNMALDEALGERVRSGTSPPIIRLYGWDPSAVSIGCFQGMRDEVDVEFCEANGIGLVRRRTGGGAVYHDREGEITYSVICMEREMPKDINAAYRRVCGWVISALRKLGPKAKFQPVNDILIGGRKVSGSAQTRREGVFLQHGTLLYDVDPRKMFSALRVGRGKILDKMISSFEERVTCLRRECDATWEEVIEAMKEAFTEGKRYDITAYEREELDRAGELVSERYSREEWNFQR